MSRLPALLAASVALALGGCGGDSEEDAVRETVEDFVTSVREGDVAAACDLLTETARAQAGGGRCTEFLGALAEQVAVEIEVTEVRVQGDQATAEVESTAEGSAEPRVLSLDLVEEDDEWRIASFGG